MTESTETAEDKEYRDKCVAFYAAAVQAWLQTRMERDRLLLTLSAGGIGLLVTLLTTIGPASSARALLYGAALISFLVTVIVVLLVLRLNADLLEKVVKDKEGKQEASLLRTLDVVARTAFVIGILIALVIAADVTLARLGGAP